MHYQSAYLKSPWKCELRTLELPDFLPDAHVLIRVEACGICGTDLSHAEDKLDDWQPFGHEIAGVIERLGSQCDGLHVGDTVVLESSGFCGRCDSCRDGRVDLCNKAPNFWKAGPSLGFSEYMIAPACCVVRYDGLTPEAASLAEPAGVAYDMIKTADIRHGDKVCLIGPGPIGLMAIPMALKSGADEVVCIGRTRNSKRLEAAEKLGAKVVASDLALSAHTELHHQFDRVLVTAPVQIIPQALSLLAYGGVLSYIGIGTGDGTIQFDANDFHYRKLQLRGSFASPALYYPIVLKMLKNGTISADTIISHRIPLRDIGQAMTLCKEDKGQTIKVVITTENIAPQV
ncbi:zinc-dependent alcohol dehydrogenase [Cohnella silvisoli]|uniref:Alcohol dehydrogenase catalytic domain-containing protein n=1 Tax=Cohnella silvisoli TaxID=2873699 RepID=A0ABV1L3H6_9BACL|nr:alcohol dehydrogenase catalytic domain-containing protein [Cohnella silvisoli]MCD9026172.1 alcohol dehydrogenase catalytic domain-containing protein [Cohnella silvisoli]